MFVSSCNDTSLSLLSGLSYISGFCFVLRHLIIIPQTNKTTFLNFTYNFLFRILNLRAVFTVYIQFDIIWPSTNSKLLECLAFILFSIGISSILRHNYVVPKLPCWSEFLHVLSEHFKTSCHLRTVICIFG